MIAQEQWQRCSSQDHRLAKTEEESLLHAFYLDNMYHSRVAVTQVMVATGRSSIVKLGAF